MINDVCWLSCALQVRPAEPRDVAAAMATAWRSNARVSMSLLVKTAVKIGQSSDICH